MQTELVHAFRDVVGAVHPAKRLAAFVVARRGGDQCRFVRGDTSMDTAPELSCEEHNRSSWAVCHRRRPRLLFLLCAALHALVIFTSNLPAQQPRRDVIKGQIRADSSAQPIVGAKIVVTRFGTNDSRAGISDSAGRFQITVDSASGDYLLQVNAVGYKAYSTRVTRDIAAAIDTVLTVDVRLVPAVPVLATVKVQAQRRQKPLVNEQASSSLSPNDQTLTATMDNSREGVLAAMASAVPGVTLVQNPDGGPPSFSILGLSTAQNAVTLNGLTFGGVSVPTASLLNTRLQTNPTDPTVGGFSGALVAVNLYPGTNFSTGRATVVIDDPILQSTDRPGRALGQQYRNAQLSVGRSGPVIRDKLTYNIAAQVGRRTRKAVTLATADQDALESVGVSGGTVDRLFGVLDSLGIPSGSVSPSRMVSVDNGALLGRIDIAPLPARTINFTANATWRRSTPTSLSPTAAPSRAGTNTTGAGGLQFEFARYVNDYYLTRTRTGFSVNAIHGTPLTILPEGRVLTGSVLSDGSPGFATLLFGGLSIFPYQTRHWRWEATQELSWFVPDNKHRPKIGGGVHFDGFANDGAPNRSGTFTFNSLEDLRQGRPTTFTRTLSGGAWNARQAYVWGAAADLWRITDRFSVTLGTRVEGNRIHARTSSNAAVQQSLGLRTDVVPGAFAVLPRLGFSWAYGNTHPGKATLFGVQPKGTLAGSLGAYRASIQTSSLGPVLTGSGLPDALQGITCVGPAAPMPDWVAYASNVSNIPTQCLDGTMGNQFGDALPPITAYLPGYDAPRAWRASLSATRGTVFGLRATLTANYSLNLAQPSVNDLNFDGTPQFTLPEENGRAVYVDSAAIDPFTGGIAPLAGRRSSSFSKVLGLSSDLRSESRQAIISLSPGGSGFFLSRNWSLSYAYARVRDQVRGFDGTTYGDPRLVMWGTSAADIRHSITGSFYWSLSRETYINVSAQARSGSPFTPTIQGDVNGDGFSNDRAFVFDPEQVTSETLSEGMRQLLATAPSGVRDCLIKQFGKPAERNSCRGPMTVLMSVNAGTTLRSIGVPRRGSISVTVTNPLGALDQLLHRGELHGWGQPAQVNPILLSATGFDPGERRFIYSVNPFFGDARPGRSAVRTPFALTLSVTVALGAPVLRQQLANVLGPGRFRAGKRLTAAEIKQRYQNIGFFDPIPPIVQARDSLLLTNDQTARLKEINDVYSATKDTVFTALSNELAAVDTLYDTEEVSRKVRAARNKGFDALVIAARTIRAVLTPEQLRLLAPEIQQMLDERSIERFRDTDDDY